MIDLISGGAKIRPQPLNTRQSEAVTVSLFFRPPCPPPAPHLPTSILYSPQFRSHQETNMAARRTQQSHGKIGDCEQSSASTKTKVLVFVRFDSCPYFVDGKLGKAIKSISWISKIHI